MSANHVSSPFASGPSPAGNLLIARHFSSSAQITLHLGDRLELLQTIKASGVKADLILSSPPYNIGKSYETKQSFESYLNDQRRTIEACLEVLSPNGSFCWQVGNYVKGSGKSKVVIPPDMLFFSIFTSYGLKMHNRIIGLRDMDYTTITGF